ncbi:MAG TPA: Ldh family oxidoreductase [Bacteroidales bacterium]|nr:Ldh family oxidoreductase [Bacteroidales bacterium]
MNSTYIPFKILESFIPEILIKAGIPEGDTGIITDTLLQADRFGFDSHGVNRLKPIYLDRIKEGIINPVTKYEIVRDHPGTAVIDGHNGMGQVIAYNAMKMAIGKAAKTGIGMVVVRNSNHYGFAGYYPLMAVKENMIGITGTNARPSIAPTFGVENMLGTNPLTFGMPSDEEFPFLLDCATSITQRGKIELYAREGKKMPEGWVIGDNGDSKTDSAEVLTDLIKGRAALNPLGGAGEITGGYKGYGYATVVEILSSALQQGAYLKMLLGIKDGKKVPYSLGHFFIAIDINSFTDPADFRKTTGNILRELRASRKMPGHDHIYTAGEKEYLTWMNRKDKGVPFSEDLIEEFRSLCRNYNMDNYISCFSK